MEHKHKPCVNRDDANTSTRTRSAFLFLVFRFVVALSGSHMAYACALRRKCKPPFKVYISTLCKCQLLEELSQFLIACVSSSLQAHLCPLIISHLSKKVSFAPIERHV